MAVLELSQHPQHADYQVAGFGQRLGWGSRPALLVIDVCAAYFVQGSPLNISHNAEGLASLDSMRRLVSAARKCGVPVVWAQVRYNHPQMLDGAVQAKKTKTILTWQDGNDMGLDALMPGLEPEPDEVVVLKRNPSAFFGTTLSTDLRLLGVDTLAITGVSTSGCIRASAMDAMCNAFRPMVVGAACGDRSPLIQQQNLFDIQASIGDVITEEEALSNFTAYSKGSHG